VKKQTSARAEGGKTIFQFNLVQLGIWITETLEWVWGTDSIVEMMKLQRAVGSLFEGVPELSVLVYLGDLYRIYCNFEAHIGSSHPMSVFWIFTSRQELLESHNPHKQLAKELAHHILVCSFV